MSKHRSIWAKRKFFWTITRNRFKRTQHNIFFTRGLNVQSIFGNTEKNWDSEKRSIPCFPTTQSIVFQQVQTKIYLSQEVILEQRLETVSKELNTTFFQEYFTLHKMASRSRTSWFCFFWSRQFELCFIPSFTRFFLQKIDHLLLEPFTKTNQLVLDQNIPPSSPSFHLSNANWQIDFRTLARSNTWLEKTDDAVEFDLVEKVVNSNNNVFFWP